MAGFSMNSIIQQPIDTVTNLGLVFQLYCEGSAGATYQWQSRSRWGTWADIEGNDTARTNLLTWVPDTYNIEFRCKLSFPDSEILYSNAVTISPGTPPNVGSYNGWFYSERYGGLNEEQRWANVYKILMSFRIWGWTAECSAAICGNMWAESGMSPGSWEEWPSNGEENTGRGYGLVQWTSAMSTIITYCNTDFPLTQWRNNGDYQVSRLKWEFDRHTEWSGYGGWSNVYSHDEVDILCENFVYGYLRPTPEQAEATMRNRKYYSNMVYEKTKILWLIPVLKKLTPEGRRNR